MVIVKSSKQTTARSLARLKDFLASLANLPDQSDAPAVRRFNLQFRQLFEPEIPRPLILHWAVRGEEEDVVDLSEDERICRYWLLPLRNAVRVVWTKPDLRFKRWGLFRILEKYFLVGDRSFSVGPVDDEAEWFIGSLGPPTFCENALMQLVEFATLTKFCRNPECSTPYFLAARKSQKFCSGPCAKPAQRSSKRSWWAANGQEWRRRREKARNRRKSIRATTRQKTGKGVMARKVRTRTTRGGG
jgi:hypothetical protein